MSSDPDLATDAHPEGAGAQKDGNQNSVERKDYNDVALIYAEEDYYVACKARAMITSIKLADGTYPKVILHELIKPISTEVSKYKLMLATCSLVFIVATKNFSEDSAAEFMKDESIAATRLMENGPKAQIYRVFKIHTQPKETRHTVAGLESVMSYDVYENKCERSRSRLKVLFELDSLLYTRSVARLKYDINEPSESLQDTNVHNEGTENQESREEIDNRNQNLIATEPSDHNRSPPDATEEGGRSNPSHNDQNHSPSDEAHQGTQRAQEQTTTQDSASENKVVSEEEAKSGASNCDLNVIDLSIDAPEKSTQTGQKSCDSSQTSEIGNCDDMKEQNKDPNQTHVLCPSSSADSIKTMRKEKMFYQHKASCSDEKGAGDSGFATGDFCSMKAWDSSDDSSKGSMRIDDRGQVKSSQNQEKNCSNLDHAEKIDDSDEITEKALTVYGPVHEKTPGLSSSPDMDYNNLSNEGFDGHEEPKSSEAGKPGKKLPVENVGTTFVYIYNSSNIRIQGENNIHMKDDKSESASEQDKKELAHPEKKRGGLDPDWLPPHRQKNDHKNRDKSTNHSSGRDQSGGSSTSLKSPGVKMITQGEMTQEDTSQSSSASNLTKSGSLGNAKSSSLVPAVTMKPHVDSEHGKETMEKTDKVVSKNVKDSRTFESPINDGNIPVNEVVTSSQQGDDETKRMKSKKMFCGCFPFPLKKKKKKKKKKKETDMVP